MPKVSVVIPSIRESNVQSLVSQLATNSLSVDLSVYVIEDNPTASFALPDNVRHFAWDSIDATLGDKSWIIPRRTDCIRSFGFWRAWVDGSDIIISLDDDCVIEHGYLSEHIKWLGDADQSCWTNTLQGLTARGIPYEGQTHSRPTVINHGLWKNVPDLDFANQLIWVRNGRPSYKFIDQYIPPGQYYPQSGMNVAFRREIVPAMYFMLMGQDASANSWGHHRFGDIWCGVVSKKICDRFGWAVHSGSPAVVHNRASDVWKNLELESTTLRDNEVFWKAVDEVGVLHGWTVPICYEEIARHLPLTGEYWDKLREAMGLWVALFDE